MRKLWLLMLLPCLAVAPAVARERAYGFCTQGGVRVYVSGVGSAAPAPSFATTYWQQSYPNCTVTVYLTGTTTLATLYSDNSSTPLSNPFTANSNGYWRFYADDGRYDVRFSGTSAGIQTPFTLADILLCDPATGCGGGGGGGTTPHNLLSNLHPDTVPYSPPIAGDTIYSLPTLGHWERFAGNSASTRKFLSQLGNGTGVIDQSWTQIGGTCGSNPVTAVNPDGSVVCGTAGLTGVTVDLNAVVVGTRPAINFIDGGGLTWTITDDSVNNRINITQVTTGGGTGCITPGHAGDVLFDSGSGCTEFDTVYGGDQEVNIDKATAPNFNHSRFQLGALAPDPVWDLSSNYARLAHWYLDNINDASGTTIPFNMEFFQDKKNNKLIGQQMLISSGSSSVVDATSSITGLDIEQVTGAASGIKVGIGLYNWSGADAAKYAASLQISGNASDGQPGGAYNEWAVDVEAGKAYFQDIQLQPEALSSLVTGLALPAPMGQVTCTSTQRGRIHYVNSGTGIADIPEICAKTAADTYGWVAFGASYVNIPGIAPTFQAISDASPISWNLSNSYISNGIVSLNHSTATRALNVSGMQSGGVYHLDLLQDSTGGAALTLGTGCTWYVNNVATSTLGLATTASVAQSFSWIYDGSRCFVDTTAGGGGGGSTNFAYLGTWSGATAYLTNNIVSLNGSSYIALSNNTGVQPGTDGGVTWAVLAAAGTQGPAGPAGTNGTNGTNGAPGAPGYSPNQILSGCGVAYSSGLSFNVSACSYIIQNVTYGSAAATVTLTTADPSQDRIDVIAVNTSGVVVVITGTPSTPPAPPSIDIATQLQLTFAYVAAGATTPSNITTTDLYHENTEWTCASSSNVNCNSSSNPRTGTKDIEWTSPATGNYARLTIPAGTIDISQSNNLVFWIRSKAVWPSTRSVTLQWYNGTTAKCTPVSLANGNFGFTSSNTTTYQQIVVPTNLFQCAGIPVTRIQFTLAGSGTIAGFYLDDIILQGGVPQSSGSSAMRWMGAWANTINYLVNDTVTYQNLTYTAIQANTNLTPSANPTAWSVHSFSVAGVAGNIQINNGTNILGAINTSVSGSDVTFPGILYATQFQSTDTVDNTQITGITGSSGDSTCPAPLAGTSYFCIQSSQWNVSQNGAAYAPVGTGGGTVTNSGTLTSGQLIVGGGTTVVTTGNLTGAVTTSGATATALAARYTIRDCEITIGDPGASSPVLANDNDSPAVCGNDYGADYTVLAVACYADAGTPTVTPILTGGSATSVLSSALTCGTAAWAAGSVNGTPTVHAFNSDGATCASTPCTLDANITTAGGTAKYIVMRIKIQVAAP